MTDTEKIDVLLSWVYEHCENNEEYINVLHRIGFSRTDIEKEEQELF